MELFSSYLSTGYYKQQLISLNNISKSTLYSYAKELFRCLWVEKCNHYIILIYAVNSILTAIYKPGSM